MIDEILTTEKRLILQCVPSSIIQVGWGEAHRSANSDPRTDRVRCNAVRESIVFGKALASKQAARVRPIPLLYVGRRIRRKGFRCECNEHNGAWLQRCQVLRPLAEVCASLCPLASSHKVATVGRGKKDAARPRQSVRCQVSQKTFLSFGRFISFAWFISVFCDLLLMFCFMRFSFFMSMSCPLLL